MSVPNSLPVSLSSVRSEFGGDTNTGLASYVAGGSYVRSGTDGGSAALSHPVPSSLPVNLGSFPGSRSVIVGNSGLILNLGSGDANNDFQDVVLPAGVPSIRIFLGGAGGGAGGYDGSAPTAKKVQSPGGAGSILMGTLDITAYGHVNEDRILRFFIGQQGESKTGSASANAVSHPPAKGGHGYAIVSTTSTNWQSWMNSYAVKFDMVSNGASGGGYSTSYTNYQTSYWIYITTPGSYQYQLLSDNESVVYTDGVVSINTLGTNDQSYNGGASYDRSTPLTRTIYLNTGWHRLRLGLTNGKNPTCIAARIVRVSDSAEIWTTRTAINNKYYPRGGNGGMPGTSNSSGPGGGGGSATVLYLGVNNSGTISWYPIALAGGGGGGGGSGQNGDPNVSRNGNWANQGIWTGTDVYPYCSGDEGECPSRTNHNLGTANTGDGAGGGGGGGGYYNLRQYVTNAYYNYPYSGMGGKSNRGDTKSGDADADGGESGRSFITNVATKYPDFAHFPSTNDVPVYPTTMPLSIRSQLSSNGFRSWGSSSTLTGGGGFAYVDWGVSDGVTIGASWSSVTANIIPFNRSTARTKTAGSPTYTIVSSNANNPAVGFVADAFGAGGNPASEYTYAWSYQSGTNVSFSSTTSSRTTITVPAIGYYESSSGDIVTSGVVKCVVSDQDGRTATAYLTWYYDGYNSYSGGGGSGGGGG